MYGLVNNGIRTFVVDAHGLETWEEICRKAGVDEAEFDNLTAYDDAHTYALVGAVSETLGVPAEQVLEKFGCYWVGFARSTAVGQLIDQGGESLIERIRGLDEMHERVERLMPHLEPPSFDFTEGEDGRHRLHYHSKREGLAPMVVGLLQGMARESGCGLEIAHVESKADGAPHDVFEFVILPGVAAAAE